MVHVARTIDAHVAGQPLRLIVEGAPRPVGHTMLRKQQWMAKHAESLRLGLLREPRGHADMTAAILTEPVTPGAHAGVIFMHPGGHSSLCGHGIMAVVTIALERGLIFDATGASGDVTIVLDTVAGTIRARAATVSHGARPRVDRVSFTNVPSFVCSGGHAVRLSHRELRVDVAYSGAFFVIVDAESVGYAVEAGALPGLRRAAGELGKAFAGSPLLVHPESGPADLGGVVFTGLPQDPEADLRNVTIYPDLAVDRSPGGTATGAVMSVLDAMGLLPVDRPFVHESVIGTLFRGSIARRSEIAGVAAISPEVEGSAWITGEHTFLIDDDDPLREGFAL